MQDAARRSPSLTPAIGSPATLGVFVVPHEGGQAVLRLAVMSSGVRAGQASDKGGTSALVDRIVLAFETGTGPAVFGVFERDHDPTGPWRRISGDLTEGPFAVSLVGAVDGLVEAITAGGGDEEWAGITEQWPTFEGAPDTSFEVWFRRVEAEGGPLARWIGER
jgi:hypothetical protein